jgi:hypothetical protein
MTIEGFFSFSNMRYTARRQLISFVYAIIVLAIIGGLTRLRYGTATIGQLNWILHWYIFGAVYSGLGSRIWSYSEEAGAGYGTATQMVALPLLCFGIPALGRVVVVVVSVSDLYF